MYFCVRDIDLSVSVILLLDFGNDQIVWHFLNILFKYQLY
jgi:hypothetical protein